MKQDIIRRHFRISGNVQGVGFRWYATHAAGATGVSGWVRNEYDGSVTMELQGTKEQIDAALAMMKKNRWAKIRRIEGYEIEPLEEERDFRVLL